MQRQKARPSRVDELKRLRRELLNRILDRENNRRVARALAAI